MSKRRSKSGSSIDPASAHRDHLEAHEDHAVWMKELERWRRETREALEGLAGRLLPDLELGSFLEALDRHEAAIAAHEELVDRHEQRLRRERSGAAAHSVEADDLHRQMHERHELSRRQHEELARSHRAILRALARYEPDSGR